MSQTQRYVRERVVGIYHVKEIKKQSKLLFAVEWKAGDKVNSFESFLKDNFLILVNTKRGTKTKPPQILGSETLWLNLRDPSHIVKLRQIAGFLTAVLKLLHGDENFDVVIEFYLNKLRSIITAVRRESLCF